MSLDTVLEKEQKAQCTFSSNFFAGGGCPVGHQLSLEHYGAAQLGLSSGHHDMDMIIKAFGLWPSNDLSLAEKNFCREWLRACVRVCVY